MFEALILGRKRSNCTLGVSISAVAKVLRVCTRISNCTRFALTPVSAGDFLLVLEKIVYRRVLGLIMFCY